MEVGVEAVRDGRCKDLQAGTTEDSVVAVGSEAAPADEAGVGIWTSWMSCGKNE